MAGERQALDMGDLDTLDDFAPRAVPAKPKPAAKKAVDRMASFPSREASEDAQINIKTAAATLDRFRAMAKAERYRHGEFLEILMDAYEAGKGG